MNGNDPSDWEELLADAKISFADFKRIDPDLAARVRKLKFLPFRVQPDFGRAYITRIDPGLVPPTYIHSWAIDIANFSEFRLAAAPDGLALNWGTGDEVILYVPETGQTTSITSAQDLRQKPLELNPLPGAFPVRIYIILRTSKERWASGTGKEHRRFIIEGLYPVNPAGDPKAFLVGDDLNYVTHLDTKSAPQHEPWFDDGSKEKVWQGWVQGRNTQSGVEVEEPRPEEGYYLVARFTPPPGESSDMHVHALVYYNEQKSTVRVYLLPGQRVDPATGLEVRLRLLGRDPREKAGYARLEGAFFDDDMRPHEWSEALMIVPSIVADKWTMVETNMLFPMARALPSGKDASGPGFVTDEGVVTTNDPRFPLQKDWLVPVYDSTFESEMENIRLQLEVTPFERGQAQLDFIGMGVGTAIKESTNSGDPFISLMKDSVSSAIDAGKSAYKVGDWIYGKVKESHKSSHPAATALPGLLAIGAGPFTGGVSAIAAGIAFFVKAFSDPEHLRLALELKIRGTITGSIYTPKAKAIYDCYLPGRFDARQMHINEGVSQADPSLHQLLPRYDRPLGHFGYRYDPTKLKIRTVYFGPYDDADPDTEITHGEYAWQWAMRCCWPAPEYDQLKHPYHIYRDGWRWMWGVANSKHPAVIDGFLPVVYNEYAEIVPVNPISSKRTQLPDPPKGPRQPTHHYIGNTAYSLYFSPAPGDQRFPAAQEELGPVGSRSIWVYHDSDWKDLGAWEGSVEDFIEKGNPTEIKRGDGFWLDAGPPAQAPPLRDFMHQIDVRTHDYGEMSVILYDEDYSAGTGVDSKSFLGITMETKHFRKYKKGAAWPLADIVFAQNVRYLYYGKTRQQQSGFVPRQRVLRKMRSPVTIT
ncbi:MAG: hypothetical protein R3335_05595, partial [Anaerolineales bacterium]|nr:hypothetical protein [Anaerolineales bacterium]